MPLAMIQVNWTLVGKIVGGLILAGILIGWLWFWLKRAKDPQELLIKWALTLPGLIAFFFLIHWLEKKISGGVDYGAAFFGAALAAANGLYFAIIWRKNVAALIARPFGDLYDGGDQEIDPQAFYSTAEAKRKRGQFNEAIAEIREQLEKFPTDVTGQMLLAEIHAENLFDLPTAEVIVQRLVNQPNHAPRNIAYALNTLADWHLKYSMDPDAARAALEQVVALLPGTEFALLAEQRIGHLASREYLVAQRDRPRVAVPKGVEDIGLMDSSAHLAPANPDQAAKAKGLIAHLQSHPQDTEAREQLAVIYADHYLRLDLAAEQLGHLINQPEQPTTRVVHWLNLLADLQLRHGCTYETVALTLSQIIERFPNHSSASLAQNRLDHLRFELKAKHAGRTVKLGTYEQDIGLKQGPPKL